MVNIVVKWGKKSFDVCLEKDSSVDLLKAQLFELTNVPLERQKLIVRGKQIKSQEDLSKVGEGMKIMMMGSAEEIPKAPENKVVFEEDLSDAQKAVLVHVTKLSLIAFANRIILLTIDFTECHTARSEKSWKYLLVSRNLSSCECTLPRISHL